jgi:hypothetical protein
VLSRGVSADSRSRSISVRDINLPISLIAWVSSFLSSRSIRLAFDGQIEPFQDIETGIPQGSPISPILFLVYIRDLFQSETVRYISYIDDISLTYSSTSFRKNSKVLSLVAKNLYRLAENNAIQFDLAKTELIHFQGGKDSLKWPITLPNSELV